MSRHDTDLHSSTVTLPPPAGEGERQLSLFAPEALKRVESEKAAWRREVHDPLVAKKAPWKKDFTTVSGMEGNPLATPNDVASLDFERDVAVPGVFPYTRGIHPTGYRDRLLTMRQLAAFRTANQTN